MNNPPKKQHMGMIQSENTEKDSDLPIMLLCSAFGTQQA